MGMGLRIHTRCNPWDKEMDESVWCVLIAPNPLNYAKRKLSGSRLIDRLGVPGRHGSRVLLARLPCRTPFEGPSTLLPLQRVVR